MSAMRITEDELTFVLQEFLRQYRGEFSHVTFDPAEGRDGFMVNFHLGERLEDSASRSKKEDDPPSPSLDLMNPLNPLSPISVWNSFGGGSSGGAGASGGW